MSRIADAFNKASTAGRMTFMPFITAGDPSTTTTAAALKGLRDAGVDLIELGFPYSDPIADGPVIQASYTRALDAGITVEGILEMMDSLKNEGLPPTLAMVSYAIVFRYGTEAFSKRASEAGFSGLIIPDLPADEAEEMSQTAKQHGLDLVQLIAPTTTAERTQQILNASTGFVYCVSVAGTTGVRRDLPVELSEQLRELRKSTQLPLAVGFGISSPEHVAALENVADGVIVGSAIVKLIAAASTPEETSATVQQFAETMQSAVANVKPSARNQ